MKRTIEQSKLAKGVAYLAIAFLIIGDSLFLGHYLSPNPIWITWLSFGVITVALAGYCLLQTDWRRIIRQVPIELTLLLALMLGGIFWSAYQLHSAISFSLQFGVVLIALFFAASFSWREIHLMLATTIRVIIFSSFAIELISSSFKGILANLAPSSMPEIKGPLAVSGHLFDGGRIQGLLGNANYLAAWALMGVIIFAIETALRKDKRWLAIFSLVASVCMLLVSRSAGMIFATIAVLLAAVVCLLAEGKPREIRHRYYRYAWSLAGIAMFFVLVFRRPVFEILGKSPDMTHRSDIWRNVLSLISQRPFEGWGFIGAWAPGVHPFEGLVVINGEKYYQAHNAYLDLWLQLGAIGLILFVTLLVRTFIKSWKLGVHHSNALYLWPILILITQLVRGVTESRLLIQSAMMLLILIAVKVYDPEEFLEDNTNTSKIKQLDQLRARPKRRVNLR
ncbi:MAG: hypothetical protein RIQ88_407 [Actinomycetota bacterium]|jgi:O-antigen ligase